MSAKLQHKIFILHLLFFAPLVLVAQEENVYEDMLKETVEAENPVYKPVIGGGIGYMGFFGDIKNTKGNTLLTKPGYRVNVSTFIDNKRFFKANFYFMAGKISADERSYSDLSRNLNFETDMNLFGINLDYGFGHVFRSKNKKITPFISLGAEILQFDTKTDLFLEVIEQGQFLNYNQGDMIQYNYWSDGTIRNIPESTTTSELGQIIRRDFIPETDAGNLDYGYNDYQQRAITVPLDIGLDFTITDRVRLRVASSAHYAFTDYLDFLAPGNNQNLKANNLHDIFTFTYVTLHLDLFSEARFIELDKKFADLDDYDMTLYDDEDNDMVWDHADNCLGTPFGVEVDSVGCPLDDDLDGVPNYLDRESNTPAGAIVNDNGEQMTDDELIALYDNSMAVSRSDIELYIQNIESITYSKYFGLTGLDIPEKFKKLDSDGDGYISFGEVLDEIDNFFDFKSTLTTDDIYELNEFFFAQ